MTVKLSRAWMMVAINKVLYLSLKQSKPWILFRSWLYWFILVLQIQVMMYWLVTFLNEWIPRFTSFFIANFFFHQALNMYSRNNCNWISVNTGLLTNSHNRHTLREAFTNIHKRKNWDNRTHTYWLTHILTGYETERTSTNGHTHSHINTLLQTPSQKIYFYFRNILNLKRSHAQSTFTLTTKQLKHSNTTAHIQTYINTFT